MSTAKVHFLISGEFIITSMPIEIHTILGSCVSVCLWDKVLKIAGMNHYMTPGAPHTKTSNRNQGYFSTHILIRSMLNRGCVTENIEAKIFGGADSIVSNRYAMGARNVEVADVLLKQHSIKILASHTGGHLGRKVIFNAATGKVKMKLLSKGDKTWDALKF